MSFLRKEYKEKKQQSADAVNEAAVAWLAENVILITERIDTKTVSRLVTSIQKFEDTFGQFRDRLPSIGSMLDSAENALSLVVTGKLNDKKTANLLLQFSYLYSTMSEFFSRDLPVLLMTKMFAVAKQNPDTTMNTLRVLSTGGPVHNVNLIHDAFVTALTPSKDERRLLKKLYRSTPLPEFDIERIASELTRLSFADLEELTKVGRIPMVAVPETPVEAPVEGGATSAPPSDVQQAAVPEGVQNTTSSLIESINNGTILLETISDKDFERLLEESKMLLTEETAEQVTKSLTNLKNVVDKVDAFEGLKAPVNALYTKAIKTLTDPGIAAFLKQKLGKNKLAQFFTTQQGVIVAQANLAIETFNSIAKAYKSAIQLFDQKEIVEKEDIENMRKLLTNAATGGIVGRISSFFKTAPYKGLEPKTIVDALLVPLEEALAQDDQETAANAADADVQQAIDRGQEV
jgi:hypothetical protein